MEADLGELEDVHATLLEAGRTFANLPPVRGRPAQRRRAAVQQRLQEIEAAWLETYEPLDRLRRVIALAQLGVAVLDSTRTGPDTGALTARASAQV